LTGWLESIHQLFGQVPDTLLEDVWFKIAPEGDQEARQLIDRTAYTRNPSDANYSRVEDADRETCSLVLDQRAVTERLSRGWESVRRYRPAMCSAWEDSPERPGGMPSST
jgi:hypothetical protein